MKKMIMILLVAMILVAGCSTQNAKVDREQTEEDERPVSTEPQVIPGPKAPEPKPRVVTSDTGELQTYEDVEPREQQECETDADCVPLPTCHPRTCINKKYTSFYERPEACTEMFDCSAAYDASACECVGSRCTNMNLGDKGCADQGESAE